MSNFNRRSPIDDSCNFPHSINKAKYEVKLLRMNIIMEQQVIYAEVYSIQHYVIKFVSDLRQVYSFFWELC